jgi:hypothetical protein
MITLPLAAFSAFIIPGGLKVTHHNAKTEKLDIFGVAALTGSLILLIFSLSEAPVRGWGTAEVLAPLIISLLMLVVFFWWQTQLEEANALIPPSMWFLPNFLVLVFVSFCTQIYLTGPILVFSEYWAVAYEWSPLTLGLHFLPMGITSTLVCILLPLPILKLPPRIALIGANIMCGAFSMLMVFADRRDRYWSYILPSMILITIGSASGYIVSK